MRCILLAASAVLLLSCGQKPEARDYEAPNPAPAAKEIPRPAPPRDDRPVVLAFGDSLSAGFGLNVGESFPDYLQEIIEEKGYSYRVVNHGISGDTTGGGLARLSQALAVKPEIVIVELGGNDGLRGLPVANIKANLDRIITAFKDAGAKVVLAGITLPRNYGAEYIRKFEQLYPELAKKHNIPWIRFLLQDVATESTLMLQDRIHPTAQGNRRVARQNVFPILEPLLKRQ